MRAPRDHRAEYARRKALGTTGKRRYRVRYTLPPSSSLPPLPPPPRSSSSLPPRPFPPPREQPPDGFLIVLGVGLAIIIVVVTAWAGFKDGACWERVKHSPGWPDNRFECYSGSDWNRKAAHR